jgi:CspA family cold shock protein
MPQETLTRLVFLYRCGAAVPRWFSSVPCSPLGGIVAGTIERLLQDKRAGFIAAADGQDYFFHESALRDVTFDELRVRDAVTFDIAHGPTRSRADVIRRVRPQTQK